MIETYHYARFSVQTAIAKEDVGGAIWQAVLPLLNNFAARAGLWPHRPLQRHGTWRRCRSAVRHHARDPVEEPALMRLNLQRICPDSSMPNPVTIFHTRRYYRMMTFVSYFTRQNHRQRIPFIIQPLVFNIEQRRRTGAGYSSFRNRAVNYKPAAYSRGNNDPTYAA
jgi:hypothetical protein